MNFWRILLISLLASSPETPGARALLERVSAAYRGMTSYHIEGVVHLNLEMNGNPVKTDMPVVMAASKPGKSRSEMLNPMFGLVRISNGENTWTYVPQMSQYTRGASAPVPPDDSSGTANWITEGTPIARYVAMDRGLMESRLLRAEPVELEGRAIDCWVVEATYEMPGEGAEASPTTFWIDKVRSVVLKESVDVKFGAQTGQNVKMSQITRFSRVRINEVLPDSLFEFHPPEGVKEVNELPIPGMTPPSESESNAVEPAVDFRLNDLEGRPTSLAAFKGKVVLLDFWATWCAPCRIEMPTIAKLGREFQRKGLTVIGMNVGESATAARAFMKRNKLTFPVLLDTDGEIAQKYGAVGLPTVVIIDRQGNISTHFVGLRPEEDLRAALKKAGIE